MSPKVKITKSSGDFLWYSDLIGEEFEVEEYWKGLYAVSEDLDIVNGKIRAIRKEDCEVIDE